jgi:hypothetical protein
VIGFSTDVVAFRRVRISPNDSGAFLHDYEHAYSQRIRRKANAFRDSRSPHAGGFMTDKAHHQSSDAIDNKSGGKTAEAHDCFEQFRMAMAAPAGAPKVEYPFAVDKVTDVGEHNPQPKTWEYDGKGNLVKAGLNYAAKYDADNKLVAACHGNELFTRLDSNDILKTSINKDQIEVQTYDGENFKATTFKNEYGRGVKITSAGMGDYFGHMIYEPTKAQQGLKDFWMDHFVGGGPLLPYKPGSTVIKD